MPKTIIPIYLGKALSKLKLLDRPAEWTEFAILKRSGKADYNAFRHLKNRGWIQTSPGYRPYRDGEAYTGPRMETFVLSPAGKAALMHLEDA